jgi:hypothetical protein
MFKLAALDKIPKHSSDASQIDMETISFEITTFKSQFFQ